VNEVVHADVAGAWGLVMIKRLLGASALTEGYAFVGCESFGVNAFRTPKTHDGSAEEGLDRRRIDVDGSGR
jgi:hypothetical protein